MRQSKLHTLGLSKKQKVIRVAGIEPSTSWFEGDHATFSRPLVTNLT